MTRQSKDRPNHVSESFQHVLKLLEQMRHDENVRDEHYRSKGIELSPVIDHDVFDFTDPDMDDEPMTKENSARQFAEWQRRKRERARRERHSSKNEQEEKSLQ